MLPVYTSAVSLGLLHGMEPAHGWLVAAAFALRHPQRWWYGFWAAVILGLAHLTSSFVVVGLFVTADHFFDVGSSRWLHLVAGGLLLWMAVHQWLSQHHDSHNEDSAAKTGRRSLVGLVGFAFVLGFAHQEEFAIIALAIGRANPWLVMAAYALAVAMSLVVLTMLSIYTLNRLEDRIHRLDYVLPKASAVILGIMGLAYVFDLV